MERIRQSFRVERKRPLKEALSTPKIEGVRCTGCAYCKPTSTPEVYRPSQSVITRQQVFDAESRTLWAIK